MLQAVELYDLMIILETLYSGLVPKTSYCASRNIFIEFD